MRKILSYILLGLSFLHIQTGQAKDLPTNIDLGPTVNLSEPPFWMPSYDEFNDLQSSQKEFYLEKILPKLNRIPSLKDTTKKQLHEASEWYQNWNNIRIKLYQYCLDSSVHGSCEDLAETRLQALELFSNQKLENRKANEEEQIKKNK